MGRKTGLTSVGTKDAAIFSGELGAGGVTVGHHDVFISYARTDRDKVEKIARALTQQGLHVWWDPKIKTGAGFREEIADALTNTRSVLVVWSRDSVGSRFVCDEADEGAARGILYPALIDNVDIPLGFRQIQTADLTHWRGNMNDPALKAFVKTIVGNISPTASRRRPAPDTPAPDADAEKKKKKKPKREKSTQQSAKSYTTTGAKRRLSLLFQSLFMAVIIAAAFAALAYTSDFVFAAYRPFFIGAMGVLAFLSRYGTLEADRAAGAASLALLPRSYMALILFSLIAISPLILEGRLYAAALQGVQVKGIEGADINSVTLEKNGGRFVTASDDGTVKIWDATTGVELGNYNNHLDMCEQFDNDGKPLCWVWGADFSPDGRTIASGSRDMTVQIWQTSLLGGTIIAEGHRASVYDVAFHPEGEVIASASGDQTIMIWNPETGEAIRTLRGHGDRVNSVEFSPDGETLASASRDGNVRLWNWRDGGRKSARAAGGPANDVKWSKDGTMYAAASDNGRIRIWDAESGDRIANFNHGARAFAVAFLEDGTEIATSGIDPVIRIWSVEDQTEPLAELEAHRDGSRGLDSSNDGKILVSGSRDNTARIWNADDRSLITTVGHIDSAIDLPFAIDQPPYFVSSQAPVPVDFRADPNFAGSLLGKGTFFAFALTFVALIAKGVFWVARMRPVARPIVVTVLFLMSGYLGLLIASALPAEALALWLTLAFVPATVFAMLRWAWRSLILRQFTKRRGKHAY